MRIGFWIVSTLVMLHAAAPAWAASSARLKTPSGKAILVSADSFYRDADAGYMELKGNVQIVHGDEHLSCDRALVRLNSEEVEADGHLLMVSPTARVEGVRAVVNYKEETGVIYGGYVQAQQVVLEGDVIRKTGPKTYEAESASFTACTTCPPAWQFSGRRIQAELGGYARIKNPLFKIAYFPLPIWLPYIVVPLKSDRQTGLLTPLVGFDGRGGTTIQEPFFWAISRSQDATFTAKHYQHRGTKGLINYRYALGEDTGGEGTVAALQDRVFVGDEQLKKFERSGTFNRWFVDYKHSIELPEGFTQKTRLALLSDTYYLRDFPEEMKGYGDPALESRASLSRNTESTHASVDASYYANLLERNPVSGNADAVHRFPELRYSIIESRVGESDFLFGLDVNFANFARSSPSYDDVASCPTTGTLDGSCPGWTDDERYRLKQPLAKWVDNSRGRDPNGQGLGSFQPGKDVIRAGQRLDIRPEISSPFHLGRYLDVLPSVSFRHTQYAFPGVGATNAGSGEFDATPTRDYVQAQFSVRTRFSAIYEGTAPDPSAAVSPPAVVASLPASTAASAAGPAIPGGNAGRSDGAGGAPSASAAQLPAAPSGAPLAGRETKYKHEIEPEASFTTLPWFQQSKHPFFGTANPPPPFLADQPISDADFLNNRGVQFDYYDRITNRNLMTFALANKLIRKSWASGEPTYKQIVNLRFSQSYDLDEARRDKYPLSDFAGLLDVRLDHFETNTLVRYFPYHGYANASSRIRVMDGLGDFVQLSISQAFQISETIDDPNTYRKRTANVGLAVGMTSRYANLLGGINYNPKSFEPLDFQVVDWFTQIGLKPPGDCWGINFWFQQVVGDGPTYKVDFEYKFGG